MESYSISFYFRQQRRQVVVHRHVDHYGVWFTDSELIKDFGGLIVFNLNKKLKEARKAEAADAKEF